MTSPLLKTWVVCAVFVSIPSPAVLAMPGDSISTMQIELEHESEKSVTKIQADADGRFEFRGLKPGKYRLFVVEKRDPMPGTSTTGGGKQAVTGSGSSDAAQRIIRLTNVRANASSRTEGNAKSADDFHLLSIDPKTGRSLPAISIDSDGGPISGMFKITENESPRPQDRLSMDSAVSSDKDAQSNPNAWRYKLHNGEWWYYGPDEKWLVHRNGNWIPYTTTSSTARQGSTGNSQGATGPAGIVDRWGNLRTSEQSGAGLGKAIPSIGPTGSGVPTGRALPGTPLIRGGGAGGAFGGKK